MTALFWLIFPAARDHAVIAGLKCPPDIFPPSPMARARADTTKIGTANQNGLVFSKVEQDVENNTIGLTRGIMTGKEGHVFAGAAIDHVSEIQPVAKIVEQLVSGL